MRVTCFLMGRTLLGWDSPEDGEPALPAATTRLVRETGRRYCTVPGSKVAFGSPRRPSPLRYGSRLACLSWGRFATCRREEAGCKPAPRKSNLPERRGRLQTCPTKEQPAGEKRQVANLPHERATCRREEAGCKPAPRGERPRPGGRLAGCPNFTEASGW